MPIYVGNTEITNSQDINVGTGNVTAAFVGSTMVFPTIGGITLSGEIIDNVNGGTVDLTEYSVQGLEGAQVPLAIRLTPEDAKIFNSTTIVTIDGLDNGTFSTSVEFGVVTIDIIFTIPNADTVNNITINATADDSPTSAITGPTTGEVGDTAVFQATVTGALNPSYQWQSGTNPLLPEDVGTNSLTYSVTWTQPGTYYTRMILTSGGNNLTTNTITTVVTQTSDPDFTCSDDDTTFSVNTNGTISVASTDLSVTNVQITSGSFPSNTGCSPISRTVAYSFQVNDASYANNGETITTCTYVTDQPGSGSNFTLSDWTGSLNVDSSGNVTVGSIGNVNTVQIISESCNDGSSSCSSQSCSATAILTGIPSGYCNSGSTSAITPLIPLTRPAGLSGWGYNDWNGTVSIANNGDVSVSKGNSGAAVSFSPSNVGDANDCSSRSVSITVNLTAPSGECNAGSVVSDTRNYIQAQIGGNATCGLWNGMINISSSGMITPIGGIATATIDTPDFTNNSGCSAISRFVGYHFIAPSGYCNAGVQVNCSGTFDQPGSGANFTQSDWNGNLSVNSSGTVSISNIGNAVSTGSGPQNAPVYLTFDNCPSADDCDDQSCNANITVGVPAGYCNSGGRISVQVPLIVDSTGSDFSCSDAGISGFSVSSTGSITAPTVSSGSIEGTITYVGSSGGSYPQVNSATTRTANFNVRVPSGECNAGALISCSATATQPTAQVCTNFRIDLDSGAFNGAYSAQTCGTGSASVMSLFTSSVTICAVGTPTNINGTTVVSLGSTCT